MGIIISFSASHDDVCVGDEGKVLPEGLEEDQEEVDVVEAGQGDQEKVEGVAHI